MIGLSDRFVGQLPDSTFRAIIEQLELPRDRQRGQLKGSTLDAKAGQELGSLRLRADDWKLSRSGWSAIETGLLWSYREGRKAFARARRQPSLEDLHAWRKRAKDLWYQERLVAPACGPALRGQAKDAHRLTDLLGDDHDLGMLRQILTGDHPDIAVDLDAVVRLIDHRRSELQTEAIYLGGRVYAEKPKAFSRRMQRCWKAGRAAAHVPLEQNPSELAEATRITTN